jgi:hypothetical protein
MSLHALAGHMASKGRGSDSMLVHMTPEEVQSLQVLALKGGGTLTINPDTGLPEANFLKKMLPMIAGFALGPAGFGLMSAGMAGAAVGGITALSTGSLSRGLMAGLGAYGGASLGASLAGAGAGTSAANAAALGVEGAATGLGSQAAMLAEQTAGFGAEGLSSLADSARVAVGAAPSKAGMLSAGFDAVTKSPETLGKFAKNNYGALAAALSPMMAADTVQTTTKRPDTGTIRNYTFDPYGQTYSSAGNYPASEYKGMAQGGIVALAAGGAPAKMDQNAVNQLVREAATQAGGTLSYADASNAAKNLGISNDMLQGALSTGLITGAPTAPVAAQTSAYALPASGVWSGASHIADGIQLIPGAPGYDPAKAAMRQAEIATYGGVAGAGAAATLKANNLYDTGMAQWQTEYNRLHQQDIDAGRVPVGTAAATVGEPTAPAGLSAAAQYSMRNSDVGVGADKVGGLRGLNSLVLDFMKQYPNATQAEINAAKNLYGYNDADVVRPYEHGFQLTAGQEAAAQKYLQDNPDVRAWLNTSEGKDYLKNNPTFDAADIAYTHYKRYGEAEGRKWGLPVSTVVPTGIDTAVNLPGGVSGGGTTVVNPNGTITTRPNIPGIPAGGFTGIGQVKDAYTQGGGSLGYVNKAPTTMDEFNTRFNTQTGDSLAAYEYLMGRGANPIKSGVGEIMRPYSEAVRGVPAAEGRPTQKYIFDPVEKKYVENPNYIPMSFNSKGERSVGMTSNEVLKGFNALPNKSDDAVVFDWMNTNNVTLAQMAKAMGITLAEAQRRRDAAAKKKTDAAAAAAAATVDGSVGGANGGLMGMAAGGYAVGGGLGALAGGGSTSQYNLGGYSDGGRLLRGPGDGVSDSIPATIGNKQPARLADGEFVVPARIVSELGNGSTEAGARKLYAMMDRVQKARGKTTGKNRVAANTRSDKYLPA